MRTEAFDAVTHSYGLRARVITGSSHGLGADIERDGLVLGSDAACAMVIVDKRVSRRHAELLPHPGGVLIRDLGSTNGTFVSGVRITEAVVPPGTIVSIGDTEIALEPSGGDQALPLSTRTSLAGLIGRSLPMRALYTLIERAAPTDYTVLLEGETGTGKEVVARAFHELSPRSKKPLVVFDCSATADTLVESELFGHVRGAFTGAVEPRQGAFRAAEGGTLFIDELSSLPLALQAKLLRAIEGRRVRPVGADHEVPVDIRVVAATNRPLKDEVAAGKFREDLYYRLCVVRAEIPPLRDRIDDIPLLVEHFLRAAGNASPVDPKALSRLTAHRWPGNVRELRNTIERAIALSGSLNGPMAGLPVVVGNNTPLFAWPLDNTVAFKDAKEALLSAFEKQYVSQGLKAAQGNITLAAQKSGLSRRHYFELLKKYGLLASGDAED